MGTKEQNTKSFDFSSKDSTEVSDLVGLWSSFNVYLYILKLLNKKRPNIVVSLYKGDGLIINKHCGKQKKNDKFRKGFFNFKITDEIHLDK